MQEEASLKSVFPSKENYLSGSMGPVTIAGKDYDVWKVTTNEELKRRLILCFDYVRFFQNV